MGKDVVTGATVEVSVDVDGSPEAVWALITDVTRIGEWSPECVDGWWVDRDGPLPRVGARFEGHNRYRGGFEATASCVVSVVDRPRRFSWVVLDPDQVMDRPGSTWRYTLHASDTAGRTTVVHRFEHGPGDTGVRGAVNEDPDNGHKIVDDRLEELRQNMVTTIAAMGQDASLR